MTVPSKTQYKACSDLDLTVLTSGSISGSGLASRGGTSIKRVRSLGSTGGNNRPGAAASAKTLTRQQHGCINFPTSNFNVLRAGSGSAASKESASTVTRTTNLRRIVYGSASGSGVKSVGTYSSVPQKGTSKSKRQTPPTKSKPEVKQPTPRQIQNQKSESKTDSKTSNSLYDPDIDLVESQSKVVDEPARSVPMPEREPVQLLEVNTSREPGPSGSGLTESQAAGVVTVKTGSVGNCQTQQRVVQVDLGYGQLLRRSLANQNGENDRGAVPKDESEAAEPVTQPESGAASGGWGVSKMIAGIFGGKSG